MDKSVLFFNIWKVKLLGYIGNETDRTCCYWKIINVSVVVVSSLCIGTHHTTWLLITFPYQHAPSCFIMYILQNFVWKHCPYPDPRSEYYTIIASALPHTFLFDPASGVWWWHHISVVCGVCRSQTDGGEGSLFSTYDSQPALAMGGLTEWGQRGGWYVCVGVCSSSSSDKQGK